MALQPSSPPLVCTPPIRSYKVLISYSIIRVFKRWFSLCWLDVNGVLSWEAREVGLVKGGKPTHLAELEQELKPCCFSSCQVSEGGFMGVYQDPNCPCPSSSTLSVALQKDNCICVLLWRGATQTSGSCFGIFNSILTVLKWVQRSQSGFLTFFSTFFSFHNLWHVGGNT